jgi:hypothetical protein
MVYFKLAREVVRQFKVNNKGKRGETRMKMWIIKGLCIPLGMSLLSQQLHAEMMPDEVMLLNIEPVLSSELDGEYGRGGVVNMIDNKISVEARLSDNVAINNVNGFNGIDNGSFAGSKGVTSVIQNTGNQVVIQNATIVNITFRP